MRELGVESRIKLLTDATTGKAIASRLGRVRHIDVSNLRIQEKVRDGDVELQKIKNKFNTVDVLTKHLAEMPMLECLEFVDVGHVEGRHELAPALAGSEEVDLDSLYKCAQGEGSWSDLKHGCFLTVR